MLGLYWGSSGLNRLVWRNTCTSAACPLCARSFAVALTTNTHYRFAWNAEPNLTHGAQPAELVCIAHDAQPCF